MPACHDGAGQTWAGVRFDARSDPRSIRFSHAPSCERLSMSSTDLGTTFRNLPVSAGTITEQSIRAHLEFLASDALNGRGSGTRDEWLAATYIASQFRLWGLEPMGDNGGYVQTIEMSAGQAASAPVLAVGTTSSADDSP